MAPPSLAHPIVKPPSTIRPQPNRSKSLQGVAQNYHKTTLIPQTTPSKKYCNIHQASSLILQTSTKDNTIPSDSAVGETLVRQDQINSEQTVIQAKLQLLQEAIKTRDSSIISFEPNNNTTSAPNIEEVDDTNDKRELDCKIRHGLLKIKELDIVIMEKILAARELKKDRIHRESILGAQNPIGTPGSTLYQTTMSDNEDDDEEFELRSIHSTDRNTFITEPKLYIRNKVGREKLLQDFSPETNDTVGSLDKKRKGYKQGDFISRNIVLGPDARYYCAMTEEEMHRVNCLLENDETLHEVDQPGAISLGECFKEDSPWRLNTTPNGFFPCGGDLEHLQTIDNSLCSLIPQHQWEEKSLIWSTPSTTGCHTPMTGNWINIETISGDLELQITAESLFSSRDQLKNIDDKIHQLNSQDSRPFTQSDLQRLLSEYIPYDIHPLG
ncbi:hypothetical protein BASA61_002182 [Batrachochytrium salamandrivorans]|nr:hypothetical protein BASA61_002182 [Batrachochytrium salamandrivorans]